MRVLSTTKVIHLALTLAITSGCGTTTVVTTDAGSTDGGASADGGARDGAATDAGTGDAGTGDAATGDASTGDGGMMPPCIPLPTDATPVVVPGVLDATSMVWMRPDADDCSMLATEPYARGVHVFCAPTATLVVDIRLEGMSCDDALSLEDPIVVAYDGAGIPADATGMGCASNDDDPVTKDLCSAIYTRTVRAGTPLTVVATSLDPAAPPPAGAGGGAAPGFGTYEVVVALTPTE